MSYTQRKSVEEPEGQYGHRTRPPAARLKVMIFAIFAVALLALSFHGTLDDFANKQLTATTNESIGILAVAGATNAAISAFQTSQLKVPFLASIEVGQLLDPVNDAVERLSSVMVWAIGSLFLQRILLEIASSMEFKWVFFVLGLAAISALLLPGWQRSHDTSSRALALPEVKLDRLRILIIRVFVIAGIIRFIVPVFISVSFLVSQMVLEHEIEKNNRSLSSFSAQIEIDVPTDSIDDLRKRRTHKEAELEDLRDSLESLDRESENLERKIDKLNDEAGLRRWLPETLGGSSPEKELVSAMEMQEEIELEVALIRERIEEGDEAIACIDRQLDGESCDSFLDRWSNPSKIWEVVDKARIVAENMVMLLVVVVIKNIVIPLIFLMIVLKCSLPMIRYCMRLIPNMKQDVEKLRDASEQKGREA